MLRAITRSRGKPRQAVYQRLGDAVAQVFQFGIAALDLQTEESPANQLSFATGVSPQPALDGQAPLWRAVRPKSLSRCRLRKSISRSRTD